MDSIGLIFYGVEIFKRWKLYMVLIVNKQLEIIAFGCFVFLIGFNEHLKMKCAI